MRLLSGDVCCSQFDFGGRGTVFVVDLSVFEISWSDSDEAIEVSFRCTHHTTPSPTQRYLRDKDGECYEGEYECRSSEIDSSPHLGLPWIDFHWRPIRPDQSPGYLDGWVV